MNKKQITLDIRFADLNSYQLDFVILPDEEESFNKWLLDSLGNPNNNWLLIPQSETIKSKTLLNVKNINRIEILDTTYLLNEEDKSGKDDEK